MAKVTFEFDMIEEKCELDMVMLAGEMHSSIHSALEMIRGRLKYGVDGKDVEDEQERFLEAVRDELYSGLRRDAC